MRLLPYITAVVLGASFVGFKVYRESALGRQYYVDISDINKIMKTDIIASASDTYKYIFVAYYIYKNKLPIIQIDGENFFIVFRLLSSIVFVPFMAIFGGYFPLAYIIFFTFLAMLSFVYILDILKVKPVISLIILILISPITSHYLPRLLLEPPIAIIVSWFLIFHYKKRHLLAGILLALSSYIRGEFIILALAYTVYSLVKFKNLKFSIPAILLTLPISLNFVCDQSNFWFWTYESFGRMKGISVQETVFKCMEETIIKTYPPDKSKNILSIPKFSYLYPICKITEHCQKAWLKDFNVKEFLPIISLNIAKNFFYMVMFPHNKYLTSPLLSRFLTFKIIILTMLIIWGIFVITSIITTYKESSLVLGLYVLLILTLSAYFPFGHMDFSRFKQVVLPFEVYIVGTAIRRWK